MNNQDIITWLEKIYQPLRYIVSNLQQEYPTYSIEIKQHLLNVMDKVALYRYELQIERGETPTPEVYDRTEGYIKQRSALFFKREYPSECVVQHMIKKNTEARLKAIKKYYQQKKLDN